jgi:hypothetical protein
VRTALSRPTGAAPHGHSAADSACPICMNSYLATLAEEEHAQAMDSPAVVVEDCGLARLSRTCGHIFCRKELRCESFCTLARAPDFQSPVS